MPELPDVEIFRLYFKQNALGKTIDSVDVTSDKILKNISKKKIQTSLAGQQFLTIKRHGKYLFVMLSNGKYLIIHFGMTGFLHAFNTRNLHENHTRLIWNFKNRTHLAYVDTRMLGMISVASSLKEYEKKLGPDALTISKSHFRMLFEKGSLKRVLMSQKKIAGIGNIYCDEILFQARLSPLHPAVDLKFKEIDRLYLTMRRILKKAIAADAKRCFMPGNWLIHFRKRKALCPKCGQAIGHDIIAGRSTYYCPNCQYNGSVENMVHIFNDPIMNVKILGTKGEIEESSPKHALRSGLLIDEQLLVDFGEKSFLHYEPKWILLTHLHPDHAYFMRRDAKEIPPTFSPIYAPESPFQKITHLNKKKKLGPYIITPIPTHHSLHVASQAYLIQRKSVTILYTGDMVWIDKKFHSLFKKIDLVITEASFIREGGMVKKDPNSQKIFGHAGIPNLIRFFKPYTSTILFMHFGKWFVKDPKAGKKKLLDLGERHQIKVLIAQDGMKVKLDPSQ
jgi:DNA-formamidopyrimidine glycosylase